MSEDQEIEVQETDTLADALNAAFDNIESGGETPAVVDVDDVVSETEDAAVEAAQEDVGEAIEATVERSEPGGANQDEPETPVEEATEEHTGKAPLTWDKNK